MGRDADTLILFHDSMCASVTGGNLDCEIVVFGSFLCFPERGSVTEKESLFSPERNFWGGGIARSLLSGTKQQYPVLYPLSVTQLALRDTKTKGLAKLVFT